MHERSRLEVLKLVVTSDEQDNSVGEIPKSFGQKTRQNAAPVFSDALAFDPVTIDDLNHLEHFIFRAIHILHKHILGFLDTLPPMSITGKSFSEALILASTNPQYDKRLTMKTTSTEKRI